MTKINQPKYLRMKTIQLILLFISATCSVVAQETTANKKKLAIISVDTKDIKNKEYSLLYPSDAGNLLRVEMEKLNMYEIMDRYDVEYIVKNKKLNTADCYGKLCLTEIGKELGVDKMMSGTIENINGVIYYSLRLIDVQSNTIEKTFIHEFQDIPNQLQNMTALTIRLMYGMETDTELLKTLSAKNILENAVNTPYANRLKLDGPRMGFTVLTGSYSDIFQSPLEEGGFNAFPMMFQFGYQFEARYLNEGNIQALFEFVPLITGLDQGLFIPSLSIMHGLRNNKNGWEFAFGPTLNFVKKANGYYDSEGQWNLENDWTDTTMTNPFSITSRIDSRGEMNFSSGFVLAFGKTFRSGKLNIPVNAYVIPNRNGMRFGLSFGFNAKKNAEKSRYY